MDGPADLTSCSLVWQNDNCLLMAWGTTIRVIQVRERPPDQVRSGVPTKYCEITAM